MLVRVFVNVNNEITNSEMRSLLTDQSVQCYNSVIIPALSHQTVQVLNNSIKDLSRSVVSLAIQTVAYLRGFLTNFRRVMIDFRFDFTLAEKTVLKAFLKADRLSRMTLSFPAYLISKQALPLVIVSVQDSFNTRKENCCRGSNNAWP